MIALGADAYQNVSVSTIPKITSAQAIAAAERSMAASVSKLRTPAALVIYPITSDSATTFRLTWKITLSSFKPLRDVTYYIDANNAQVVAEENNIRDNTNGNISGSYWPVHNYDTPVGAGFWTTGIYLHDAGNTYTSYTNSDNSGNYTISIPYSGTWHIQYPLQDSWVSVGYYSTGQPVNQVYTTSGSGTYNLAWGATDGTSVRWLATVAHDFYKSTFGYTGMDYQAGAYISGPDTVNGGSDGYNIYFGSQSGQEWARSSDVVYHEYAHCVIVHLYGGRFIGSHNYDQGSAMDEGLADYWACTYNNDPVQAEDCGVGRDLQNTDTYPTDYDSSPSADPHQNGLIVSGACWDMRQSIGATIANDLVFGALEMSPHAYNFDDFETNIITMDDGSSPNFCVKT